MLIIRCRRIRLNSMSGTNVFDAVRESIVLAGWRQCAIYVSVSWELAARPTFVKPRLHDTTGCQTFLRLLKTVWQPAVSCKQTSNRLSSRLSNGFDSRFDNRVERTAVRSTAVRSTGCQTGLYNWQPVVSCTQTYTRLWNRSDNRFDNRLCRVNGALECIRTRCWSGRRTESRCRAWTSPGGARSASRWTSATGSSSTASRKKTRDTTDVSLTSSWPPCTTLKVCRTIFDDAVHRLFVVHTSHSIDIPGLIGLPGSK